MVYLKRFLVLTLIVYLMSGVTSSAQSRYDYNGTIANTVFDVSNSTKVLGFCQIVVTTTATSLSSLLSTAGCTAIPTAATLAWILPESTGSGAVVRWRSDGITPTSSVGFPIQGWQAWPSQGVPEFTGMQLISATGSSVTVDVQFKG